MGCEVYSNCVNNGLQCWVCRFDPENNNTGDNFYNPFDKSIKHPVLEAEKQARKDEKKKAAKDKKQSKDKDKSKLVRKAAKVEKKVKETLNSGRSNKDGDLTTENIAIDVKLQSTRVDPVVDMNELKKIQNDAYRAGKVHGCLLIENKNGERIVVMTEEMFRNLI